MYTTVLVLGLMTSIISDPKPIMLDIYTRPTSTGQVVKCQTIPSGTLNVDKGRIIQINVQTRSKLLDLRCSNAKGETVYDPTKIKFKPNLGILQQWVLDGTTAFTKDCAQGSWTCKFRIQKSEKNRTIARRRRHRKITYSEGKCILQLNVTGCNPARIQNSEPGNSSEAEYSANNTVNYCIIGFTSGAAILLLLILIIVLINNRRKAKVLEERENELERMRDRAPARVPSNIIYDYVYQHGAGLLRKAKGKKPHTLKTGNVNPLTVRDY